MTKLPPNIFTSLDLELNQDPSGPKIIQIGACVGNLNTGEMLDKMSIYINPHQNLTPEIIKLTKIQQRNVEAGVDLVEGVAQLEQFHTNYGSFVNFVVWGQGDVKALREESGLSLSFAGRREIDVKTLYVAYRLANGMFPTCGLSRAVVQMKLQFKGQAHDAYWDSFNTWQMFKKMVSLLQVKNES